MLLLVMWACSAPPPDTDGVLVDTDVADTDIADTDITDTDIAETDAAETDSDTDPVDADGDGWAVDADCDDAAAAVHPGAPETCDGLDDDCDGLVDDADPDRSGGSAWFADGDGDGWGAGAATSACIAPTGMVADATDCDDADATTHPGAERACDGLDHACDGAGFSPGTVTFIASDGTVTDWTAALAGSPGSPATATLSDDGALVVCDATLYANLDIEASVSVIGVGDAWLRGGGVGTMLAILGDDLAVAVSDLSLAGGIADTVFDPTSSTRTGGGALVCLGDRTTLVIDGIDAEDNLADLGGAVAARGCTVEITNSVFRSNDAAYGGAIAFKDADATITDTEVTGNAATKTAGALFATSSDAAYGLVLERVSIDTNEATGTAGALSFIASGLTTSPLTILDSSLSDNTSTTSGGAIRLYADPGPMAVTIHGSDIARNRAKTGGAITVEGSGATDLSLDDTRLTDNVATSTGGAIAAEGVGTVICSGDTGSDAGFFGNQAPSAGAVYVGYDMQLGSRGCDWGSAVSGRDNRGDDVIATWLAPWGGEGALYSTAFAYADDETFSCVVGYCGTAMTGAVGGAADTWGSYGVAVGNVFTTDGPATLSEWTLDLSVTASCRVDWAILARETGATGDWTVAYATRRTVSASTTALSGGGIALLDGHDYAIVAGALDPTCGITWYADDADTDADGFATLTGSWWDEAFTVAFRDADTVADHSQPDLLAFGQDLAWWEP